MKIIIGLQTNVGRHEKEIQCHFGMYQCPLASKVDNTDKTTLLVILSDFEVTLFEQLYMF